MAKYFPFMLVVFLTISCILQSSGARSTQDQAVNTDGITTKAPKPGFFKRKYNEVKNFFTNSKTDKKSLETDQSDNGEGKNTAWSSLKTGSGQVAKHLVNKMTPVAVNYANKGIDRLASKLNAEISKSHQSHSEIDQEPHQVDHRYHVSADVPHGYGQQRHDINYGNAYSPDPAYPLTGYPHPGYQDPSHHHSGYPHPGYQHTTHHHSGYPHPGYQQPTHHQSGYPHPGYQHTTHHRSDYPRPGYQHAASPQLGYQPTASPHLGYQQPTYQNSAYPKPTYTNPTNYPNHRYYGR